MKNNLDNSMFRLMVAGKQFGEALNNLQSFSDQVAADRTRRFTRTILITLAILFTLTFLTLSATAQDTTQPAFTVISSGWSMGYNEKGVRVMINQDSVFEIEGDSLGAIKLLWAKIEEGSEREERAWREYGELYKAFEEITKGLEQMRDYNKEMSIAIKADLVVDTVAAPVMKPRYTGSTSNWILIAAFFVVLAIVLFARR